MKSQWKSVFPELGETRVRIVQFDPARLEETSEPETAGVLSTELPGLLVHMEPDNPGMHTTNSVDYGILIEGKMTLEVDDGESVDLDPGDIVIQNGTRHAWHYKEKCTIAWILIGAGRHE